MNFETPSGLHRGKPKGKRVQRRSIYDRQREEETIRNATNRGYLRRMTVEFLNDNIGLYKNDLPTVGYLNITSQQLNSLGALEMCVNLRICILPGNYITEFDALIECVNLWALDLHGNQIRKVPGPKFWITLQQLQVVLLHDNGISKLQTIHHLSSSPSLTILTLYDTPLSLKKNYRHHVVNGVWSLKALDFHVVSDEEIIEDCKMPNRFAALNGNFRVDLIHTLTKQSSLQEAVKQIEELISKVNQIQAKFCPVLLIQKTFRMLSIRERYKQLMDARVWAATLIQRFYRHHKGLEKPNEVLPSPSSPFNTPVRDNTVENIDTTTEDEFHVNTTPRTTREDSCAHVPVMNYISVGELQDLHQTSSSQVTMQGSRGTSQPSTMSRHKTSTDTFGRSKASLQSRGTKSSDVSTVHLAQSSPSVTRKGLELLSETDDKRRETLKQLMTIDLIKLKSSAVINNASFNVKIDSDLVAQDKKSRSVKVVKSSGEDWSTLYEDNKLIFEQRKKEDVTQQDGLHKRRFKPEMIGKYRTVRVFLGDVVKSKVEDNTMAESSDDETIGFRLLGEEPPKQRNEPLADMLLSKKAMGENGRCSLRQFYRKQSEERKKRSTAATACKLSNDQKLFLRTHGTMGLACLRAVHEAYSDRASAQRQAELKEKVSLMKERRESAIERFMIMKQENQENILQHRIRDGVKILDSLRENEAKKSEERRKVSERRAVAMVTNRIRQSQLAFVREFACQQNSISQALRNHDRAEEKKEEERGLGETVRRERENQVQKQKLVKKYMEHRRLMNQAEMSKTKADINTRLLEQAKKRYLEIKRNMKHVKKRDCKVTEYHSLSAINVPNENIPLAVMTPSLARRWEKMFLDSSSFSEDDLSMSSSQNVTIT